MLIRRWRGSPENHQSVQGENRPNRHLSWRLLSLLAVILSLYVVPTDSSTDSDVDLLGFMPSLILTGFGPYSVHDFNASENLVMELEQHCESEGWGCLTLTGLPVKENDPGSAAEIVIQVAREKMPQGGVIIAFGQDPGIASSNVSLRLEYFASDSAESWLQGANSQTKYHLDDPLYQRLAGAIKFWESVNFRPAKRHFESTFGERTAGGYICEVTAWELWNFAQQQQANGVNYLVLFVHVPALEALPEEVTLEAAVLARAALAYHRTQNPGDPHQVQVGVPANVNYSSQIIGSSCQDALEQEKENC